MEERQEHWQIQYGLSDDDCKKVDVICTEAELAAVCWSLERYDAYRRGRPVACVAKRGCGVSFRNFDYMCCDCM